MHAEEDASHLDSERRLSAESFMKQSSITKAQEAAAKRCLVLNTNVVE